MPLSTVQSETTTFKTFFGSNNPDSYIVLYSFLGRLRVDGILIRYTMK